jgi:hypothetical protein
MDQRQQRWIERKKRWEQQRRQEQRAKDRAKEREQRAKIQSSERSSDDRSEAATTEAAKTINDLPAEMIHEIFDSNPQAGLVLARTNKWFNKVLKDKIKKHKQLIRECNSASACYSESFHKILVDEHIKTGKKVTDISIICYFQCCNCFRSFEYGCSPTIFLIRPIYEVHENGIVLCLKCLLKYYGYEMNELMREREERLSFRDLDYDSEDSDYYSEDEHYE